MSRLTSVVSVVGMSSSCFIGGQSRRSYVRRRPSPSARQISFLFSRRFPEGSPPLHYTGTCKAAESLTYACRIGGSDRRKILSRVLQRGRRSKQERYPMRLRVLKAP